MTVGAGVVGLGFMGRTHAAAYQAAGATLVAVCDRDASNLSGDASADGNLDTGSAEPLFDPSTLNATADLHAFLATPGLDLVSICTPTDTHAALASRVIAAGKHLIIEKPVALDAGTVAAIDEEARRAGVLCMPAMCMRFWPAWAWVKRAIDEGRFGPLAAIRLERLGARPAWGESFYSDESRSGGALFDLHVHDTDFLVHCLGSPSAVRAVGSPAHVSTTYTFDAGPANATAHGGWLPGETRPFTMRLLAELERATIDFDLARDPQLMVHERGGASTAPEIEDGDGWRAEIAAMVHAVASAASDPPATMASAVLTTAVLEAERRSLASGTEQRVTTSR